MSYADWFIQGHRFDIYEGIGCFYAIPNTIFSWVLMSITPIIIGCISGVYCSKFPIIGSK